MLSTPLANNCKQITIISHYFWLTNLFCSGGLLPKLSDVATQQAFKPWELNDNMYRIKLDLAAVNPQVSYGFVM